MGTFPAPGLVRTSPLPPSGLYPSADLCNLALLKLGANFIRDINESSPSALRLKLIYPYKLEELLLAKDWRFAKNTLPLVRSGTSPVKGFLYAYLLPSDYLKTIQVPSKRLNYYDYPVYPPYPYRIQVDSAGIMVLMTDYADTTAEPLYMTYIARESDESKFSPMFREALVCLLAKELCAPTTDSASKLQELSGAYYSALTNAGIANEFLDSYDEESGESWVDVGRY